SQHLRGHEKRFRFYVGESAVRVGRARQSSRFGGRQPTRGAHNVEEPGESRSSATDRVLDSALLPRLKRGTYHFYTLGKWKAESETSQ
ncbi:hypothetical protein DBV15_09817, partial [Temnothorax longispinosus]